jgi:hypothetical protein
VSAFPDTSRSVTQPPRAAIGQKRSVSGHETALSFAE